MNISVSELHRTYRVQVRPPDRGWLSNFVRPSYDYVEALRGVSFEIASGEAVGYIGANGAGKSTTFKILAGILAPSSGTVSIDGLEPLRSRRKLVPQLAYFAGQRTALWWDLPVKDTFELLRHLYEIPLHEFRAKVSRYVELMDLTPYLNTPVRQLSLGNRTRADLVAALLHAPRFVLLDEPTVGLDLLGRQRIHDLLQAIRESEHPTILLASHDLRDVEALCDRVLLLDQGQLIFAGSVAELIETYGGRRTLRIELAPETDLGLQLPATFTEAAPADGATRVYTFDPSEHGRRQLLQLLDRPEIIDFTVEQASLTDVVREIYATSSARRRQGRVEER